MLSAIRLKRLAGLAFYLCALISVAPPLYAHEGHDHAPPEQAATAITALRATAHSELFELVAVPDGSQLIIYLDRWQDNAPVTGATLELESDSWQAEATELSPGTYRVEAPFVISPGQYELMFTITTDDDLDLLTTTLDISPLPVATAPEHPMPMFALMAVAIVIALLLLYLLLRRTYPSARK
ncbi:hypothetical protein [Oceanisphaera arctica]|uniref:CopC domain-containing protein n=1 Tax=Oceanisphaera arctica TaxID=641510 RepID=A0A2P5TR05_9GAMM|nr:hypothetical protein [Oceanisphaera arctica]PPL18221.1 hypothetical protein UN63_01530 [Oceanisphaera arctica]GHA12681.1 hypothetical protein GCM10007082_12110 [Oceanisphaera arctica]